MSRPRTVAIFMGAATVAVAASAVVRHVRGASNGRAVRGGIVIGDAAVYDAASRLVLGPFLRRIAADIVVAAPDGARLLEIGCGPGHLSIMLARRHGLDVTGLDLDPAMVERARANAVRTANGGRHSPSFLVGDVASLAFPDGSFDLVVSRSPGCGNRVDGSSTYVPIRWPREVLDLSRSRPAGASSSDRKRMEDRQSPPPGCGSPHNARSQVNREQQLALWYSPR
jgi:SAM-dependent methyltransferase